MRVEHIIWDRAPYEGTIRGLLKVEYGFHGDAHTYSMIVQGEFNIDKEELFIGSTEFVIPYVAYVRVEEVGVIAEVGV